jgi:hypothetical protein
MAGIKIVSSSGTGYYHIPARFPCLPARYSRLLSDLPSLTMDQLTKDRIHLVRLYLAHPAGWPDGIDPKGRVTDTKYGRWYTGHEAYWHALAVTKTPSVTETPVTETPSVTKTVEEVVTRLGRPKKDGALSAAERKRLSRERAKVTG